jgi:hypothetical protein
MITDIKANVDQITPTILSEGQQYPAQSVLGQLFTADWYTRLALAGRVYSLPLGTISGAASYTALTGNATVDNDQPEFIIAADSGWLIPIVIDIQISVDDVDAYDDVDDILVIADRSQATAAGATATVATPLNHLDGGDAFSGRCFTIVTGDVTDPVGSDILAYKYHILLQVAAEATGSGSLTDGRGLYKEFKIPRLLAGPCQIVGFVTGTNTPTFMGEIVFAHIPSGWAPTS